jgi:hypothetical protein
MVMSETELRKAAIGLVVIMPRQLVLAEGATRPAVDEIILPIGEDPLSG